MEIKIIILIAILLIVGGLAGLLTMFAARESKKDVWVHLKHHTRYRIIHYGKMKRPDTGEWLKAITYVDEEGNIYTRWHDDFLISFQTLDEWEDVNNKGTKI